jgi:hypothetical protein
VKKAPRKTKAAKPRPKAAARTKVKRAAPPRMAPRADLGAPIDGFFARQAPALRPILEQLRALVEEAAPKASSSLKWGMPFYEKDGEVVCALAGFKAHVNLILPGPPGTYDDPDGLLEGGGKTGRHLKVRTLAEMPRSAIRGWLRTAATRAGAR